MFWKSKKKPTQIPKQALILKAYLASSTVLLGEKRSNPITKAGLQVFILGMADMLRHAEKLSWDQFIAVYRLVLAENDLLPAMEVDAFVSKVGELAARGGDVEKLIRQGAQSFRMYFVERDANAPIDLIGATMFAEKNPAGFASIVG